MDLSLKNGIKMKFSTFSVFTIISSAWLVTAYPKPRMDISEDVGLKIERDPSQFACYLTGADKSVDPDLSCTIGTKVDYYQSTNPEMIKAINDYSPKAKFWCKFYSEWANETPPGLYCTQEGHEDFGPMRSPFLKMDDPSDINSVLETELGNFELRVNSTANLDLSFGTLLYCDTTQIVVARIICRTSPEKDADDQKVGTFQSLTIKTGNELRKVVNSGKIICKVNSNEVTEAEKLQITCISQTLA